MPKLKALGSDDVIRSLETFGFAVVGQKGSHVKLARHTALQKQVLTIPQNKTLPKGTLKAIYNQAGGFVSREELHPHFYAE